MRLLLRLRGRRGIGLRSPLPLSVAANLAAAAAAASFLLSLSLSFSWHSPDFLARRLALKNEQPTRKHNRQVEVERDCIRERK